MKLKYFLIILNVFAIFFALFWGSKIITVKSFIMMGGYREFVTIEQFDKDLSKVFQLYLIFIVFSVINFLSILFFKIERKKSNNEILDDK